MNEKVINNGYEYAKQVFADFGIDTEAVLEKIDTIPVSMHSWQGDDLIGFDGVGELTGGLATTGNYPGRARTADELRSDITKAVSMIPGSLRIALHACHAEKVGKNVDRDAYSIELFQTWVDWAKEEKLGLDFNPTFFSHPKMDGDFSLSSSNKAIQDFWIEHGKRCREIGTEFGKQLGSPCVTNFWMPDGYKDVPADTAAPRVRMIEALNKVFDKKIDPAHNLDSLESKLFGFGIESYTVVSHEFAMSYCLKNDKLICLDAGHFHPTETIASKFSAIMPFVDQLMLHVSRGIRWDSDHVVILEDSLQQIMDEVLHNGYERRIHIGLDYFDASINRIAAWVIGTRNVKKALLKAGLNPIAHARVAEANGDFTSRLALLEENKFLPYSAVWDYYCLTKNVPVGKQWLDQVKAYESTIVNNR